jgi:hypothetical protein
MKNVLQQDLDLWEVWIEFDQFDPEHFGTLYVHGEVSTNKHSSSRLIKMDEEGCQLTLQLPSGSVGPRHMKELLYSEPIRNLNQYTSVCICEGDTMVALFDDIETMI